MQSSRLAFVAAIGLLMAACAAPPPPSVQPLPPAALAKVDAPSRALLELLGPGEWATGDLTFTDVASAAAARRAAADDGLQVGPGFAQAKSILIVGPAAAILDVGTETSVVGISMQEDIRAQRSISAPFAAKPLLPVPGAPYAAHRLVIPPDIVNGAVPADRRALLIDALSDAITTIDGRAYAEVESSESCDAETDICQISITGRRQTANLLAQEDGWSAQVSGAAVSATVVAGAESSIPRWLAREAERVARTDADTAARIGRYTTLSAFRWASGGNLVIFIEYTGPCQPPRGRFPDCLDTFTVAVDPAAGTVVDVTEELGR